MRSFILLILFSFVSIFCYSINITIAKGENTPDIVCNETQYNYIDSLSAALPSDYVVEWQPNNGITVSSGTNSATIKWQADSETDGSTGTLYAVIKNANGDIVATPLILLQLQLNP